MTTISNIKSFEGLVGDSWYKTFIVKDLSQKNLMEFFLKNNICQRPSLATKKALTDYRATDFIHFIWMGNPLRAKYKNNILKWREKYPEKEIIIWVDQEALNHKDLKDFALKNDIKLLDLEKVFTEEYDFGLNELIQLEKNRLPPNWGAASDMYRYLIMYYFAGTYSDTDVDVYEKLKDQEIDFDTDFSFHKLIKKEKFNEFSNDFLVTKNLREDFWKDVMNFIKIHYFNPVISPYFDSYSDIKYSRCKKTIFSTGPGCLLNCIQNYPFNSKTLNFMNDYHKTSDMSWSAKLSDKKCKKLAQDKNIVDRIINNVFISLKETSALDLTIFDKIIEKITDITRDEIINKIKLRKSDLQSFKIKNIFASSAEEFEDFLKILPRETLKIKSHYLALKIAGERRNKEMFEYLYQRSPNDLFSKNILSKKMLVAIEKIDKSLVSKVVEQALINKKEIILELGALVLYFENKPEKLFYQYGHIMLHTKDVKDVELKEFEELLKILPLFLLDYKNRSGENILHIAAKSDDMRFIKIIKKVLFERDYGFLFDAQLYDKDRKGKTPIDYSADDILQFLDPSNIQGE